MNSKSTRQHSRTNGHYTFPLIELHETDSTSNYLNRLCLEKLPPEYTTVTAEFQSAGKGQRGNRWESASGKNLLFSFVLYPTFLEAKKQFILSQLVSLAVKEELEQWADNIRIKWPNDIYLGDSKLCGMLLENDLSGPYLARCIAGIGININQDEFYSNAPNPISLKQATGREYDRKNILTNILQRVNSYYEQLRNTPEGSCAAEIAYRYVAALYRNDGYHPYRDDKGEFLARMVGVEPDGRYVLEDRQGNIRKYLFKEVQFII